ncbi:MAG: redoxin domain-containing protein [Methanomicrobiales archaeon]|jgi:thiol-disulfide isomerase/thioredoxin|nr:redoxin domain-containing protein [Methanomicrobiales archaeon]
MNRKTDVWQREKYRLVTLFLVLFAVISLFGSVSAQDEKIKEVADVLNIDTVTEIEHTAQTESEYAWMKIPMEDAINGGSFTFEEYTKTGSPVVIHLFAIWCSICTLQLQASTAFQNEYPGKATIIGIDIDETESSRTIAQHIMKNGFTGTFTAAPKEVSMGLAATFGPLVLLQIPQTIVIVDKDIFYLGAGLRTTNGLSRVIDEIENTRALME